MGEIYRARDSRLGREVALKILPPSFAANADRLRRFEQEARAVAALNHPNILAVHDIGQHDGTPFMVSELLEGESLRSILVRGVPPQRKAIEYALQIAQGLAAAHGKNIAHRDLKPDNIFVTREGRVKILDFGLAKTVLKGGPDAGTATMSAAAVTEEGTVLGTAGYMSPEQVRGTEVDCRTDIFSFGAVLYEMLSGKRAFKRDTAADTMAAILHEDPPELLESGRQIPPALDRIVRHCLEKAPEQRFQSARDLAFDLESITTLTPTGSLAVTKGKERSRWWYAAGLVAVLIIAALTAWKISASLRPVTGSQFHQVTSRRGTLGNARFTPDGQNIIYTAAWEGSEPELYTVAANAVGGHALGIQNARLLAVSKRGEIAVALAPAILTSFLTPGTLARTTDSSSAPKPEIENIESADFTPNGSALAIVRCPADEMCQLEYPIGKVLERAPLIDNLRFSPDGRYLAFITHDNPSDDRGKAVILRSTGEKVAVSELYGSAQGLAWNPSGDEVWFSSPLESGEIHAMNLSGKARTPMAVPGRVHLQDISPNGQLLVQQGIARRGIVLSTHDGKSERDLSWLDFGYLRDISSDSKMILFEEEGRASKGYELFVRNVDGSPAIPIGEGYGLALSPDKHWALGQKLREPADEIWLYPIGPGEARCLTPANLFPYVAANFLSDSKRIVYMAAEAHHPARTWLQDINGGQPRPITPEGIAGFQVSPDDQWVITGSRIISGVFRDATLRSIENGNSEAVRGLKPDEVVLGWTSDSQLYVASLVGANTALHIDKLNPHTGARMQWRDLAMPPIGGVFPDPPIITPDGSTYGYDYRLRLSDLYTVTGVR